MSDTLLLTETAAAPATATDPSAPLRAPQRRFLPEGRLAGPMPWVIAVMVFLSVLATTGGLAIARATGSMGTAISDRITVQIVDANLDRRQAQRDSVLALLRQAGARDVTQVTDRDVRALLTPWLGREGLEADLPVPALIDATLPDASSATAERTERMLQAVSPQIRVDRHAAWLAPIARLLATLGWLAAVLVTLTIGATAAAVVLGARAALDQHRPTIDVMHLIGATDRQIARLFERRVALDALSGTALGFVAGAGALIVVWRRFSAVDVASLGGAALEPFDWVLVALVPVAVVGLAIITARLAVLRVLAKIL